MTNRRTLALLAAIIGSGLVGFVFWGVISDEDEPPDGSRVPDSWSGSSGDVGLDSSAGRRVQVADAGRPGEVSSNEPDTRTRNARGLEESEESGANAGGPRPNKKRDVGSHLPDIRPAAATTGEPRRNAIRDGVREAMDRVGPQLRTCYENLLTDFPGVSGEIVVTFEMNADSDGSTSVSVAQIGQGTTMFEDKMQECVLSTITEIDVDVPPSADGTTVTYPVHFASREKSDAGGQNARAGD